MLVLLLLLVLVATACRAPGPGATPATCELPPGPFWSEAGLHRDALDLAKPHGDEASTSALALDRTVLVLGLCGAAGRLERLGQLRFAVDAGRPPRIAKVVTGIGPGSTVVIMTPVSPSATRLTVSGGPLRGRTRFDLPQQAVLPCDVRSSRPSVSVERCGAWTTVAIADVPRYLLTGLRFLDIEVRNPAQTIEVMPFVEDRSSRPMLFLSGPFEQGHRYRVALPGDRTVSFVLL